MTEKDRYEWQKKFRYEGDEYLPNQKVVLKDTNGDYVGDFKESSYAFGLPLITYVENINDAEIFRFNPVWRTANEDNLLIVQ